jgi:hypothetical protein
VRANRQAAETTGGTMLPRKSCASLKFLTRRALLAALPACLVAAGQTVPRMRSRAKPLPVAGEFSRFTDPTTETSVVRLTSLKSASYLPAAGNRFVSVKDRSLIFSSDRAGLLAPFQVDLRSGAVRQLAAPAQLVPSSLCLDPKEHWLYFLDGEQLVRTDVTKKEVLRQANEPIADGVNSFSIAPNGSVFVVRHGTLQRLEEAGGTPLATEVGPVCCAQTGNGTGCLFSREMGTNEREFWYAGGAEPVLLAKGAIANPFWAPDGRSILFLRDVSRQPDVALSEIHEVTLDGAPERCIAPTSMFVSFAPNFDASVFVGASRSKAQPNVVLLLRSAKREMTLCQHHASRATAVSPVFSPDARRVYFQSDEEGKPALYSVNVEMLVEPPGETIEG